jgi:hypothetical protein
MQRDRFFIGILVGIGVLAAAALILFFVRQGQLDYGEETQPDGVLRNYILAVQRGEYERAYDYVYDSPDRPDFLRFQKAFLEFQGEMISSTAVEINDVKIDTRQQTAIIQVTLLRGSAGLFESTYRDVQTASLIQTGDGWKVYSAPYPFWSYDWTVPEPVKSLPALTPTP